MLVTDCTVLDLPKLADGRGNLSIIEDNRQIPFAIKRAYWIYDVPGGDERGGHAYRRNQEFIVALSGSFDVVIRDGQDERVFSLNRSYKGVYVPGGLWRVMRNFSTNSVALILASEEYDEGDYIMDFDEYKQWKADEAADRI